MVKEGYWYGLPLVLISGGLVGLGLYGFGIVFLVAAILVLNFFRDPERTIPSDPSLIVSPADGRVVQIVEEQLDGRPVRRVSIFMSPFDVHVNRAPAAGTIESVVYHQGTFRMATHAEASIENEQNVFTIASEHGPLVVKQIAGLLARRIVFWKRPGDPVRRGERVGLIKFGSRVDVALDPQIEMRVAVGERVRAGASVLAVAPRAVTGDPLLIGNQPESQEL